VLASAFRPAKLRLAAAANLPEVRVQGIIVKVDRPVGYRHSGVDENGEAWQRIYTNDYGFIPKTKGGDGEALDVFLGPNLTSKHVFWVRQVKADKSFDEYKLFIGFSSS